MVICSFKRDFAITDVGIRFGCLCTVGAVLRKELELKIIGGGRVFVEMDRL